MKGNGRQSKNHEQLKSLESIKSDDPLPTHLLWAWEVHLLEKMSGSLRLHMNQAGLLGWVKEIRASSKRYLCYSKYSEENGKKLLSLWYVEIVTESA